VKKILSVLFSPSAANQIHSEQSERGFALIEMVVALVIMALVGLMAWRGMDAMIRGREVIDKRANQDADYSQLVRQFERDCQSVLSKDEIASLASSVVGGTAGSAITSPVAAGAKNIWFLRRYRADNMDAWLIAGYVMGPAGLQRWTSRPLMQRTDAGGLWAGITRDPDLSSSDLLLSLELPSIVRQSFQVQTSVLNGAGGSGISASGTGSATSPNSPSSTTPPSPTTPGSNAAEASPPGNAAQGVIPITADQQGVMMQWWIRDVALPMTRSCLMGGAL
jgi:prepilin-type N-terminal cleavage/methylation domain-containing protein